MGEKYTTIKIREQDHVELVRIAEKTGVSLVNLIGFAVPKLKSKYRIKDEAVVPKEETNGNAKL